MYFAGSLLSALEKGRGLLLEQNWIPFTQGFFVPHLIEICPVVLMRRFLNFVNVFLLFRNYLPWEKMGPFLWINLNSLYLRILCAKIGWNWLCGSEEVFFLILFKYFRYFVIIPPLKRAETIIWTNLHPFYQSILFANFGRNWPSGSGAEDEYFLKFTNRRTYGRTADI